MSYFIQSLFHNNGLVTCYHKSKQACIKGAGRLFSLHSIRANFDFKETDR